MPSCTNGRKDIDFVLMGPSGFLGAAILRYLESSSFSVYPTRLRLKDRLGLEALLDEIKPKLGVICAAGERGRPKITWCDSHPVETVDANITGQLSVAAVCHERGLHVILVGTGALYVTSEKKRKFSESDPPNGGSPGVYTALRQKMEELTNFFENALVIRVLYPLSSDLDARGLLGKLATWKIVFHWADVSLNGLAHWQIILFHCRNDSYITIVMLFVAPPCLRQGFSRWTAWRHQLQSWMI